MRQRYAYNILGYADSQIKTGIDLYYGTILCRELREIMNETTGISHVECEVQGQLSILAKELYFEIFNYLSTKELLILRNCSTFYHDTINEYLLSVRPDQEMPAYQANLRLSWWLNLPSRKRWGSKLTSNRETWMLLFQRALIKPAGHIEYQIDSLLMRVVLSGNANTHAVTFHAVINHAAMAIAESLEDGQGDDKSREVLCKILAGLSPALATSMFNHSLSALLVTIDGILQRDDISIRDQMSRMLFSSPWPGRPSRPDCQPILSALALAINAYPLQEALPLELNRKIQGLLEHGDAKAACQQALKKLDALDRQATALTLATSSQSQSASLESILPKRAESHGDVIVLPAGNSLMGPPDPHPDEATQIASASASSIIEQQISQLTTASTMPRSLARIFEKLVDDKPDIRQLTATRLIQVAEKLPVVIAHVIKCMVFTSRLKHDDAGISQAAGDAFDEIVEVLGTGTQLTQVLSQLIGIVEYAVLAELHQFPYALAYEMLAQLFDRSTLPSQATITTYCLTLFGTLLDLPVVDPIRPPGYLLSMLKAPPFTQFLPQCMEKLITLLQTEHDSYIKRCLACVLLKEIAKSNDLPQETLVNCINTLITEIKKYHLKTYESACRALGALALQLSTNKHLKICQTVLNTYRVDLPERCDAEIDEYIIFLASKLNDEKTLRSYLVDWGRLLNLPRVLLILVELPATLVDELLMELLPGLLLFMMESKGNIIGVVKILKTLFMRSSSDKIRAEYCLALINKFREVSALNYPLYLDLLKHLIEPASSDEDLRSYYVALWRYLEYLADFRKPFCYRLLLFVVIRFKDSAE